jgi:hypothetical protein
MLDGSTSSGSGGRALNYDYSVAWVRGVNPQSSLSNMSALLNASNLQNDGKGAFRVHVPSAVMPPGVTMELTLRVENFIGEFDTTKIRLRKLTVPAPDLQVGGANPRTDATFSSILKLQAVASLPVTTCVDEDLVTPDMSFQWKELTGKISDESMAAFATRNPRVLSIPAGTLAANLNYKFEVTGFMKDDLNVTNAATVLVNVAQQAVVARIAGGSSRQVGNDSDFSLDGGGSEDPDQSSVPFAFKWSCAAVGTGSCDELSWNDDPPQNSYVNISAGVLPVGRYSFTLTVEKGSTRNDTVTANVEIVSSAPPIITISGLNIVGGKYNSDGEPIKLSSSVVSSSDYTTEWRVLDGDVDDIFLSGGVPVRSVSNKPDALIDLSPLTRGRTYTLQLAAENSVGARSQASVSLTVNEPPSSGKLVGLPEQGWTLETEFDLAAMNWVDADMPLKYRFGTVPVNADLSLDTRISSLRPFGNMDNDASIYGLTLSQGNFPHFTIGCYVQVIDSYGAIGSATDLIQVLPTDITLPRLANISQIQYGVAFGEKNVDLAKQIVSATTAFLTASRKASGDISGDEGRRRHLLQSTHLEAVAKEMRINLLNNLWETFRVTPITSLDITSTMNTLAGIVDTPEEVGKNTGVSALKLLDACLSSCTQGDVGISSSASNAAAEALSSLFGLTSVFNATDAASLNYAVNATNILRLISTSQLKGTFAGGIALSMGADLVDMISYRSTVAAMSDPSVTLQVTHGADSTTPTIATFFDVSAADLVAATLNTAPEAAQLLAADGAVVDVKVATIGRNIFKHAFKGTAGTDVGSKWNGGIGSEKAGFPARLRSKLTVVEASIEDSTSPLPLEGLAVASPVYVKMPVEPPFLFNTTFDAYIKPGVCVNDTAKVGVDCPLDPSTTHKCDFEAYGNGTEYFYTYYCPMVVPTCITWNEAAAEFSVNDGCEVQSGYSQDEVTCSCTNLKAAPLALGSDTRKWRIVSDFTAAPTSLPTTTPTAMPTPVPTQVPSALPTTKPTSAPTLLPTEVPSSLPTTATPTSIPTPIPTRPAPWIPVMLVPYSLGDGMKLRQAMEGFTAPFDAITSVDGAYSTIQPIKLVLAFSRDLQDYAELEAQVSEVQAVVAAQEESWTRFFTPNVESFNCNNTLEEDMYDPSQQGKVDEFGDAVRWVGGPNRQFEKMMRWVMENIPNAVVFMKEFDTVPQMDNHFGNLLDEIIQKEPFYMLGR